jgi:hypothetical protein
MHNITKLVVAVLVAALIVVIGLIYITQDQGAEKPAAIATAQPVATAAPSATDEAEKTEAGNEMNDTPTTPEAGAESAMTEEAAEKAQENEAQGTMYEGALAGLSEEEIAKLAMAEEEAMHQGAETEGAEGAVD